MEYMREAGITVSQVNARNDTHTAFKDFKVDLPGVDEFASEQVAIPVGWWLSEEQLDYIIHCITDFDGTTNQ